MHIVFFISDISSSGGTERISFLVANYLVSIGHKVSFISLNRKKQTLCFELDASININLVREGASNPLKDVLSLRKILKKHAFDIFIDVDAVLTPYSMLAKLFTNKIKHVVWEHFNASINLGIKRRDLGRYLGAKYADKCVVLTQEDQKQWQAKYSAKNVEVIYNPVTAEYARDPAPVARSGKKVILGVGRLADQKGFDLLLMAWNKLPNHLRDNALLKIAGHGPNKAALMDYVTKNQLNSSVEFLGYCSNISEVYQDVYVYVLSSRFEGFVLSLLEAMASGLPVISFDCPCGPKELLAKDAGILVDNGNVTELSQALERILSDTEVRNQIAIKSYARSFAFSPDKILPLWNDFLEGLK